MLLGEKVSPCTQISVLLFLIFLLLILTYPVKRKQRAAFDHQTRKNAPEIAFFEEKLGLKIQGRARSYFSPILPFFDLVPTSPPVLFFSRRYCSIQIHQYRFGILQSRLLFRVGCIISHLLQSVPFHFFFIAVSPTDHHTCHPHNKVSALTPTNFIPPHVVAPLISNLNSSRNLYDFTIQMRIAFKTEVKIEKINFVFGAEGEREKDVERKKLKEV